jgi:hypothetical protein
LRAEGEQFFVHLEAYFESEWEIALSEVGVVTGRCDWHFKSHPKGDLVFIRKPNIFHPCTHHFWTSPRLMLLFRRPQRVPSLVPGMASIVDGRGSAERSRSEKGVELDGAVFQIVDPSLAAKILIAGGAEYVSTSPGHWLARYIR